MKRIIALALALVCLMSCAYADAQFEVTEESFIKYDDDNAYYFAKIENTGDAAGYVGFSGTLNLKDASGNSVYESGLVMIYPSSIELEPGEFCYAKDFIWDSDLSGLEYDTYGFTPESSSFGTDYTPIECDSVEIAYIGADSYDNYIYTALTNSTSDVLYDLTIVTALYDESDNLIFVNVDYNSSMGINPGSSVTFKTYIDYAVAEYYDANGIKPVRAESYVYMK